MRLVILALSSVLLILLLTRQAAADVDAVLDARAADGLGSVDALRLGVVGAGVRVRAASSLELQALVLTLVTQGDSDLGPPARGGGGGELGLRVAPWSAARLSPYLAANVGLLLFPRVPFLPGGDDYEGIISFAVGADLVVAPRWRLGARGFTVHLSNGQGLGPHNPAYDGFGAGVDLAYTLVERVAPPARAPPPRTSWASVATAEVGGIDGAWLFGARAQLDVRLARRHDLRASVDASAGSLDGEPYGELGAAFIARPGDLPIRAGVYGGYRRWIELDTAVVAAQLELTLTPEVDLLALGEHERTESFRPRTRAAVGVRANPTATLTVDLGIGFDRIGDDAVFGSDDSDPYLGVVWKTPLRARNHALEVFVERQVSGLNLWGARVVRGRAWRRLR